MTVTTQPENGTLGVLSEPTITSGVYAKWTRLIHQMLIIMVRFNNIFCN